LVTQLKVIMFTDQVNSTMNMAQRTPDEITIVSRAQTELTTEAVSRCRGVNPKDTGDGHMIQFHSCRDAVRCGSLLQRYVSERNKSQRNELLKFQLHIGIDLGEAVVLDNDDLRANAANMAARVTAEGPRGEVYFTGKVAQELHEREANFELVGSFTLRGIGEVNIYRLKDWLNRVESTPNPFIWRDGITRTEDFFEREYELRRFRDYLRSGTNCQIVGPRRIGKSSLLRQVESKATKWEAAAVVAYVDQQDPLCWTRKGWLKYVSKKWDRQAAVSNDSEFSELVDEMRSHNRRPVLCIDEFEAMRARPKEFNP
jgi:class 3 adenylate cyclase